MFGGDLHYKKNDVVFSKSLENILGEQLSETELEYLKIKNNRETQAQSTEEPRISIDLLSDPVETSTPLAQDDSSKPRLSRASSFGSFVQAEPKGMNAITEAKTVKDLKGNDADPKSLNLAIESLAQSLVDTSLDDRIAIIRHLISE